MAIAKTAKNTRKPARSSAKPVNKTATRKTVAKPSAVLNKTEENSVVNQKSIENSVVAITNSADVSADFGTKATKSESVVDSNQSAANKPVVKATTTSKPSDVALNLEAASTRKVFEMNNMEIPAVVREAAEKTIEQAQSNYNKFKDSAEEATNILEDSIETSRKGIVNLQEKVIDAAKTNTEATFEFYRNMVSVRSFSEALELQSGFARQQYETVASQGKDIQETTTRMIEDVTSSAKKAVDKVFSELKAA